MFQMASNNTSNVDNITVDEKLDEKLRILKVFFVGYCILYLKQF